jgi:hypothetical protein
MMRLVNTPNRLKEEKVVEKAEAVVASEVDSVEDSEVASEEVAVAIEVEEEDLKVDLI